MKFKFYALWLCVVCIFLFVLQTFVSGFTETFLLNQSSWIEVWRFLTSIFLHGDIVHLLYNLFALALFGSMLERLVGGRKFLIIFFVTGIIANLVAINFYSSSLGASGAIFGVIGALVLVRPMLTVWAFSLPMPIFVAGILWAIIDLIGTFNPTSNTGTIAHLSGMAVGLLFGAIFRNWKKKENPKFAIDENIVRSWEDTYLGR